MALFFSVCLQNSLTRSAPLNSEAQGRSGARFHTSYDKRYVIKTISSEDVAEMHNILKKYHQVSLKEQKQIQAFSRAQHWMKHQEFIYFILFSVLTFILCLFW